MSVLAENSTTSEVSLEAGRDLAGEFKELLNRFKNRFSYNNPRLVERYTHSECEIVLHLRLSDGETYFAHYRREPGVGSRDENSTVEVGSGGIVGEVTQDLPFCGQNMTVRDRRGRGQEQPVFVHVVEGVELPEKIIPSFVRLQLIDGRDYVWPHASYFSFEVGGAIPMKIIGDRETGDARLRRSIVGNHELPDQIIKGAADVLETFSDDGRECNGDFVSPVEYPFAMSRIRVEIGRDGIMVAIKKDADLPIKLCDMLFGPI